MNPYNQNSNSIREKNRHSVMAKFFLHLAIIECLLFSGASYIVSTYFGREFLAMIIFCLTCFACYLTNRNPIIKRSNLNIMWLIVLWVICVTFVFGQGNHNFQFFSYLSYAFGFLLIVTSIEFNTYRDLLLRYLSIISVVSIIVHLGHEYWGLFPSKPFTYPGTDGVHYYSYVFNTEIDKSKRLASIYWEPGQYQIVITYVLVLFADKWSDIRQWKNSIKKFGVLVIALLMTFSTMAYLIMMLMIIIILVRSGINQMRILPIYLALGMSAFYYLYNSEAIQKKVEQSENEDQSSSYTIRMADNIGCLMVTLEDPLTGYGPGSDELEERLFSQGSLTSSNGWLLGSARLGIPYILFLWLCMWRIVKRINPLSNHFLLFAVLVISQCNEAAIYFPYMYMYIFSFSNYRIS